tara:strand:- start:109 stop:330 length:222 start_codon:yes stop_codon:yes gene_type:complete
MSVDETKWDDVWKLICDVRKVDMAWIERWDLVRDAEGDSEEEKAKKVFSDPDSPLCLDWSKDLAEIRTQVTQL